MGSLEMKNTMFEIKYSLERLSRLEIAEVRVNESEDRVIEIYNMENREKMSLRDPL